ncbi:MULTISPECIES: hypothetical protein [Micromonospora]|uniref:Uncharacterized protein n=1 Tax=Micromonospora solifontis TaxID=2487138 RepID=A0ABX9WJW5_9ACTN|nr:MULTISPECIES: hypothetical protein [Micromonospora]NES13743.1 hypothetical protein [Micromonospora sp. PPF5-17B]NES35534.1 hypothetical protein [Micromonospora solifontis]NES55980.1 hypothetical protein [Micromonospora sp. PPF5-6]RNM00595.1 hypothetical protein EFE23_05065 [Micromonospora solifontis]
MADRAEPLRGVTVAARSAWGALLLLAPRALLRPVGPATTTAVVTLRVLGARHLVQAAVTVRRPTPGVFAAGAAVDGLHSLTALALAAVDRRQRSAALANAAVAAGWALLGALVAGRGGAS